MKRNAYNKYYLDRDYFGKPYPGLVDFFLAYEPKGMVLDLGCGQGRDALTLGHMGYQVTGVDISEVGIKQMNEMATREGLPVKGIVADMYMYPIGEEYDMVLLDSMFHFYTKDRKREEEFLLRILNEIKPGGIICNFMQKGEEREKYYRKVLASSGEKIDVVFEGYTEYPEYEGGIHFHICSKVNTTE